MTDHPPPWRRGDDKTREMTRVAKRHLAEVYHRGPGELKEQQLKSICQRWPGGAEGTAVGSLSAEVGQEDCRSSRAHKGSAEGDVFMGR